MQVPYPLAILQVLQKAPRSVYRLLRGIWVSAARYPATTPRSWIIYFIGLSISLPCSELFLQHCHILPEHDTLWTASREMDTYHLLLLSYYTQCVICALKLNVGRCKGYTSPLDFCIRLAQC